MRQQQAAEVLGGTGGRARYRLDAGKSEIGVDEQLTFQERQRRRDAVILDLESRRRLRRRVLPTRQP